MRDTTLWTILRLTLAGLIAAHGGARRLNGAVEPFGAWLDGLGLPLGLGIAWGITLLEILGTVLLALGRWVLPLCVAFALVYLAGLFLVHMPAGWFVVGLGRNGMEYSVLLVVALCCVGVSHRRRTPARRS